MQKADAAVSQRTEADRRAEETERQMTDDERFSLLVSVMGTIPCFRSGTSVSRREWR